MSKRQPARARHKIKRPSWEQPRSRTARQRKMPTLRRVPLATVDRCEIENRPKPSAERIHCICGKTYAGCSAMNDEPFIDTDGEWTVARRLYCDHCDHLMMWLELCKQDGTPMGVLKCDLATITDKNVIQAFLRKHPWAAGISQT